MVDGLASIARAVMLMHGRGADPRLSGGGERAEALDDRAQPCKGGAHGGKEPTDEAERAEGRRPIGCGVELPDAVGSAPVVDGHDSQEVTLLVPAGVRRCGARGIGSREGRQACAYGCRRSGRCGRRRLARGGPSEYGKCQLA